MFCRLSLKYGHLKFLPLRCPLLQPQEARFCSRETKIAHKRLEKSPKEWYLVATASEVALYAAPVFLFDFRSTFLLSIRPSITACKENSSPFYGNKHYKIIHTQKLYLGQEMSSDSEVEGKGKKEIELYAVQVLTDNSKHGDMQDFI